MLCDPSFGDEWRNSKNRNELSYWRSGRKQQRGYPVKGGAEVTVWWSINNEIAVDLIRRSKVPQADTGTVCVETARIFISTTRRCGKCKRSGLSIGCTHPPFYFRAYIRY